MNNKELIAELAQQTGYSQTDTQKLVRTLVDEMGIRFTEGDSVYLNNFGTFEVKDRAARKGVNPRTKEEITIEASKLPSFKAGKALKEAVSK